MAPSGQEIDHSDHHPAIESSESVDRQAQRDTFTSETPEELLHEPTEIPTPTQNEDHEQVRGRPYSDIPEWLQEFTENLVDERVLEQRLTREFFSLTIFRTFEKCGFWVSTV